MAKKETYKSATQELEKILTEIQSPNVDIDTLTNKIKRASELIKWCKEKLRSTEKEINGIFEDE